MKTATKTALVIVNIIVLQTCAKHTKFIGSQLHHQQRQEGQLAQVRSIASANPVQQKCPELFNKILNKKEENQEKPKKLHQIQK